MKVDGLHHVTAITADIEANPNFYGRLLLGFAIAVSAGIAASAIKLVGRTTPRAVGGPTAAGRGADSPDGEPGHQPIDKPKERRAP